MQRQPGFDAPEIYYVLLGREAWTPDKLDNPAVFIYGIPRQPGAVRYSLVVRGDPLVRVFPPQGLGVTPG